MIWNLSNSTRYAAGIALAADRDGRDVWLTVVKATFDIAEDGEVVPADEQLPIVYAPIFAGDAARSSLLAESDIDYAKPCIDVLVQGTVHAPRGRAVRQQLVALEVAGRQKVLRVFGERTWCRGVTGVVPSEISPFTAFPLAYEQTFGGFDPAGGGDHDERNPAGCGFARRADALVGLAVPRIEHVDIRLDARRPAGLGPIARHWLPRRRFAGSYDAAWTEQRMPLLPLDFDERFFSAAPEDQQFAQLPPRASIRLEGMTRDAPLACSLPRLALGLNVQVAGARRQHRRPNLRTLLVLPDSRKLVLTYADAMECTGWKFDIRDVEVVEKEFIQ